MHQTGMQEGPWLEGSGSRGQVLILPGEGLQTVVTDARTSEQSRQRSRQQSRQAVGDPSHGERGMGVTGQVAGVGVEVVRGTVTAAMAGGVQIR